jgi:hypothetical protein
MSISVLVHFEIALLMIFSGLGHSADPSEIDDLEKFLEKHIPAEADGPAAGL